MMGIKDATLKRYLEFKLDQINNETNVRAKIAPYGARTVAIRLIDGGDNVGFGWDHIQQMLVTFDKIKDPTLLVSCTKRVFRSALAGKTPINTLFYGDIAQCVGKNIWRDKVIIEHIFDAMRQCGVFQGES